MAPLLVLLSVFAVVYLADRFILTGRIGLGFAGRIAMSAMLVLTGIAHFTSTDTMVQMMPDILPAKRELVYLTGVLELLAAGGLLWQRAAAIVSLLLIVFFLAVLPANIAGSLKEIEMGGMEYGPLYLIFRIPLQFFFIWWAWFFGVRRS
ncbi:MAG TPA: hypothetical protein PKD24_10635 [Pyrinomonadaceae bacterium]|nr:hypothetical protein [Pyrinomonadaceae bacterium]HMP65382.1 hypothetical protein [Pyrinomonadaceae bacterium]